MGTDPRDGTTSTPLAVYACRDGTMLFVPSGEAPVPDAIRAHGPLTFRGHIDVDPRRSATWRELLAQIDRHRFATVGLGEVALLLGPDVATLCTPPAAI
ncbi:hypothetical protein [Cognatilysobacter segetis]|uniref:hypothetical protein n=1 Tax=Cognatilysobacter segetis TaxID=2492394 RepID=UPI00105D29EF|nr:hypothetical protein [Lysobacter segetis]